MRRKIVTLIAAVAIVGTATWTKQEPASGAAPRAASGTLTIAQGVDPVTMDAQRSTVQQALNVSMEIDQSLDRLNYQTHKIEYLLATSIKYAGNKTWKVMLRKGVKFTDGEPFNASVVKYSIDRVKRADLKAPAADYVTTVKSVKVVSPTEADFVMNEADPTLPLELTQVAMLPPKYIQKFGDTAFAQKPVGTGPYTFVEWVKDDHVTMQRNPHYWGKEPAVTKLVFRSIPDDATRLAALESGQVNIASEILPADVPALKRSGYNIVATPSLRSMVIQYNLLQKNELSDVRVRQALNYAVNTKALIKSILGGYGKPLQGQPLSSAYLGYDPKVKAFPYSPSRAKALLAQAGYTSSHPLSLTLLGPSGRYVGDREVTEAVAGQLQAVGIKVTPNIEQWAGYLNQLLAKSLAPMFLIGYATTPDAGVWLSSIVGSKGAYSFYKNPQVDSLLNQGLSTMSRSKRQVIYNKLTSILHDQAPFLYLYQGDYIYGTSKNVQGFKPNPDESVWMDNIKVK